MKTLILSNGNEVLLDSSDFDRVSQYKWHFVSGYARTDVYLGLNSKPKYHRIYMHRLLMGFPKNSYIDHINGNKLDNRQENLRICTKAQNTLNRGSQSNSSSGIKGVNYFPYGKRRKRWIARLNIGGRVMLKAYFLTKEEASEAYDEAAMKYHGEFAKMNNLKGAN